MGALQCTAFLLLNMHSSEVKVGLLIFIKEALSLSLNLLLNNDLSHHFFPLGFAFLLLAK